MKYLQWSLSAFLLLSSADIVGGTAAGSRNAFTPYRIHYNDIHNNDGAPTFSLLDALEDSSGIVSMTNLPENFSTIKKDVMTHLHSCLLDQQRIQDNSNANDKVVVAEESFKDGTVRRTFATATMPTNKDGQEGEFLPMNLKDSDSSSSSSCRSFEKNLQRFREITDDATKKFAKALSNELEPHLKKPLLNIKGRTDKVYDTIDDLVSNGEILEHFHSYQKIDASTPSASAIGGEEYNDDEKKVDEMKTIDLHADQGFFIAFTPGMMIGESSSAASASDGFYIVEDEDDGHPIHVDFDIDNDDLVFMLGDGVNQYINNRLIDEGRHRKLRATPHAVSLKYHDESVARVWYGRMVLPPNDALVVLDNTDEENAVQTTLTYGDVRRRLVETHSSGSDEDKVLPAGLGCSSPTMRALAAGGLHDEPSTCEKGTLFCWARCMELSTYDITEEMCEEQNLDLKCINPRGQFQTGERHGDFWPACTNTTKELTPYPEIPQRDEESCNSTELFDAFVAYGGDDDVTYDHSFDLSNDKNNGAVFQWSVVNEDEGIIRGRLVFGDVFGWLAFGFAYEGGKHNGMNGGNILMAIPGDNYTAMYGLVVPGLTAPGSDEISVEIAKSKRSAELTGVVTNPPGSSVDEYQINHNGSSFRHWSEPTGTFDGSENEKADVVVTDCFTALSFVTKSIDGKSFNVSGVDDMMWGGNSKDYHVGYHGRGNRARFYINWLTGDAWFWEKPVVAEHDDGHGHVGSHDEEEEEGEDGEEEEDPMTEEDDEDSGGAYCNQRFGSLLSIVSFIVVVVVNTAF